MTDSSAHVHLFRVQSWLLSTEKTVFLWMVYCVTFLCVCELDLVYHPPQLTRALWMDKEKKDHKASNAESQTLPGEVQLTEGAKGEAKKKTHEGHEPGVI